jgi:hypothetical protein
VIIMTQCPINPNWSKRKDNRCKRYDFCDSENTAKCGAAPVEIKSKFLPRTKECLHKNTKLVPTGKTVMISGRAHKVFKAMCSCGYSREVIV